MFKYIGLTLLAVVSFQCGNKKSKSSDCKSKLHSKGRFSKRGGGRECYSSPPIHVSPPPTPPLVINVPEPKVVYVPVPPKTSVVYLPNPSLSPIPLIPCNYHNYAIWHCENILLYQPAVLLRPGGLWKILENVKK